MGSFVEDLLRNYVKINGDIPLYRNSSFGGATLVERYHYHSEFSWQELPFRTELYEESIKKVA